MALANFFDKIALNAAQLLQGMKREELERRLSEHRICVNFDTEAADSTEGKAMLDLVVRLLARLYPYLRIECTSVSHPLEIALRTTAQSINPRIESFPSEDVTVALVAGKTTFPVVAATFYIGSDDWVAKISSIKPLASGLSANPLGAGAAACIGAANVFRQVFSDLLPHGAPDTNFSFSLLNGSVNGLQETMPLDNIDIGEVHVIGLGAIGNGFIWALKHLPAVSGRIVLVDGETVSLSNLQRYVLAEQDHVNNHKTEHIVGLLRTSSFESISEPHNWQDYLQKRQDWNIETVISCLDSAEDRIAVQAALPRILFNGWTQPENLGVSRHLDFLREPGLCCLYHPTHPTKSRSQEIADNLYLPHREPQIRSMLANHFPVDQNLIAEVHQSTQIPLELLHPFLGQPLDIFYSEIVCGGAVLRYKGQTDHTQQHFQVPCAFESAMAGILLVAELIKYKSHYPVNGNQSIRMNLLRPLTEYLHSPEVKRSHCLCTDPIFKAVYSDKWKPRA